MLRKILIVSIIFLMPSLLWAQGEGFGSSCRCPRIAIERDDITICYNAAVPAESLFSFAPLLSMHNYNYAAFSITASDSPDTVFYQIILGTSPYDTTTVWNAGSTDNPKTLFMLFWDSSTSSFLANEDNYDLCQYHRHAATDPWQPSGYYVSGPTFDIRVVDEAGYPGVAEFLGIRILAGMNANLTGLRITAHLMKIFYIEGE